MINIFKKNKVQKSSDPNDARVEKEPTFSKLAVGGADNQSADSGKSGKEIPPLARLAGMDPELRKPVVSNVRPSQKSRPSTPSKPAGKSGPAVINGTVPKRVAPDRVDRAPTVSASSAPARTTQERASPARIAPGRSDPAPASPEKISKIDFDRAGDGPPKRKAKLVLASVPSKKDESGRDESDFALSGKAERDDALPQFKTPPLDPSTRRERPSGPLDGDSQAKLWEAFTPTKPKRWSRYFAGRRWAIQRVITAIEEEQAHVVIFGARGIGKTSLANIIAESASQVEYQVLRCPCSADITFEEIFRGFLRNLPSEFMDRSARAKNPAVEHFEQLLPRGSFGPTELTVALSYLKLEHVILIVDEFDRVNSEHLKNQLAETIKNLSDISARITFIVVGIAQNLDELIGKHPSIQRHLAAVHLPLMEAPELRALIEVGESASGMRFDEATRESVISFAKGLPYYAQLMCLYSGRHALERGSVAVEMMDLREAMAQVLDEADPVTAAMYDMATQGERNGFMNDVMFAAARCRFDRFGAFTAADAADVALDMNNHKLRELTLHKALTTLTLPQNGAVLEKQRTPSGTTKYSFQHQTMRQYILVRQARQRGLI